MQKMNWRKKGKKKRYLPNLFSDFGKKLKIIFTTCPSFYVTDFVRVRCCRARHPTLGSQVPVNIGLKVP